MIRVFFSGFNGKIRSPATGLTAIAQVRYSGSESEQEDSIQQAEYILSSLRVIAEN